MEFLGYVIGKDGIKISKGKVEAVVSWKPAGSITEDQSFLGFANFSQQFIQDYARVARALT